MRNTTSWSKLQNIKSKQIVRLQNNLLQEMMPLFAMTPYYHSVFKVDNIGADRVTHIQDLQQFPFTTKKDLLGCVDHPEKSSLFVVDPTKKLHKLPSLTTFKLLFSRSLKKKLIAEFKPIHALFTRGRDAESVPILYTEHDMEQLKEAGKRMMAYWKIPSTTVIMNVFPFGPDLPYWQAVYTTTPLGFFGLHTGGGKTMHVDETVDRLEYMEAEVLMGTPSYVMHLAMRAATRKKDFSHVRWIILGGECVTPSYTHKLTEILSACKVTDLDVRSIYGFAEGKVTWTQCHEESGYHLYPDMAHVEIIDESGNNVADGESGEIVYTSLDHRGTIILRYKTGDFGRLEVGPCQYCGTHTPRLDTAIIREQHIVSVKLTKGKPKRIDFNALRAFLSGLHYLDYWQIVLKKNKTLDNIHLFIATHDNASYVKKEIIREMQDRFSITPKIAEKKHDELIHMLGLDGEKHAKRVVDER